MITPEEAQKLAIKHIEEYVNACQCRTVEDVGNVLLMLLSTTGHSIVSTQGQEIAIGMLIATAQRLAKPEFSGPFKQETTQ
jgi:hypothetical protein